ncbi:MAG: hypothetical protein RIF32_05555 [Leptospirales bacterium]|jgi:hypothetical protein
MKALSSVLFFATLCLALEPGCLREIDCASADPGCNASGALLYVFAACERRFSSGNVQGCPLDLTAEVTTFAGSGAAALTDGVGVAAAFNESNGSTSDGTSIFIADAQNGAIRKIDIATATVSTVISGLATPVRDVVSDGTYLYVAEAGGNRVLRVTLADSSQLVLAGSGAPGDVDGFGTSAQLRFPHAITVANGFLYVAQNNGTIRRINLATTEVITYGGTAGTGAHLDGPVASALFSQPNGLVVSGNALYVAEAGNNHTVRKIDLATNFVTTVAGTPGVAGDLDGFGTAALMNDPYAITTDGPNLYVTEFGGHIIRKIELATGRVIRLAGQPGVTGSSDGVFEQALFNAPRGITTDGVSLYISDSTNNTIRRMR